MTDDSPKSLSHEEAAARLAADGPNELGTDQSTHTAKYFL